MNNTTFWNRICKAFGGSRKDKEKLAAEEERKRIAVEEEKFLEALRSYDVQTVKDMLDKGFDPNHQFSYMSSETVDYDVISTISFYRALDVARGPMQKLLRAYGAKTTEEFAEERRLEEEVQKKAAEAKRQAEETERKRLWQEKLKRVELEVDAICAEKTK